MGGVDEETAAKVNRLREIGREIADLMAEQQAIIMQLGAKPEMTLDDRMGAMSQIFRTADVARLETVMDMTGRTKRTIYRWMDTKGFPQPEKVRGVLWFNVSAVKTWWAENAGELGRWPSAT